MAEKVTKMALTVDLQCCKCYKKVKKVLCKFPGEIRDQVYDEKNNKVTIKVVCCCPEKMRDKLCCKGRGCIESIEILEPPKHRPPPPSPPVRSCCSDCSEGRGGGPCYNPCYGIPVYDSWGGGCRCGCRGYYGCRCREDSCEDPQPCRIILYILIIIWIIGWWLSLWM